MQRGCGSSLALLQHNVSGTALAPQNRYGDAGAHSRQALYIDASYAPAYVSRAILQLTFPRGCTSEVY